MVLYVGCMGRYWNFDGQEHNRRQSNPPSHGPATSTGLFLLSNSSRWIFNLHSKLRSNMQILQYYIMNGLWYDEWASCHPPKTERVKQSGQWVCRILEMKHKFIFFQHDIFQRRLNCCCTRVKNWAALKPKKSGEAPGDAPPRTALFSTVQPGPALAATPTAESSQILTYT